MPTCFGRPVRLFDARRRRLVELPPPGRSPLVLRVAPPAAHPPGLTRERGVIVSDTLRRLLRWKGYEVRTAHRDPGVRPEGEGAWRARPVNGYPIDVLGRVPDRPEDDDPEVLCQVLVGPVELTGHLRGDVPWHRGGREVTLPDLTDNGVTAADFRLAMLMAGHYRRPRRFRCDGVRAAGFLEDARNTRRRLERLARDLGPLPSVPTFVTATLLVPITAPGSYDFTCELAGIDAWLTEDLHTPRVIAALHVALRHRFANLSDHDRKVLLAAAQAVLALDLAH